MTADKDFCDDLPRRRRGLRRQDLVLDHADRAVPRRPHRRQVHGLRRLDPGLDRDQGLSPCRRPVAGCAGAARAPRRPPPASGSGCCLLPPMLWLVRGLPRRARRRCSSPRSGARTPSPARSSGPGRWTTSGTCSRSTSTGRSRCARSASRALVTVIDAVIAFPIALYMAKVASPAGAAAAGRRGADAAVGDATWSRRTPGGRCSPRAGVIDWLRRAVRAAVARLRPDRPRSIDAGLPVAAVHDPADLRRPRAAARLAARGLRRPRRAAVAHAAPGGAADGVPGDRRRLDLHVLAVARRLHRRPDRRRQEPAARQRRLRQRRRGQQPAVRGRARDHPGRGDGRLPAAVRRTGALENL